MGKFDPSSVEEMTRRDPAKGVLLLSDDRETSVFEMTADLVFPPGARLDLKQGSFSGFRLPSAGGERGAAIDPLLQHSLLPGNRAGDDYLVGFANLAFAEEPIEVVNNRLGFPHDEATAGFPIEPVDDMDSRVVCTMTLDPRLDAAIAHAHAKGGLVDHEQVLVLVENRQRSVQGGDIETVREKNQVVATLEEVLRQPNTSLVNPDTTLIDDGLDLAEG